ncbi:MAG: hypothetical protein ACYSWU_06335, partial [Planctomycetota bacterium]
ATPPTAGNSVAPVDDSSNRSAPDAASPITPTVFLYGHVSITCGVPESHRILGHNAVGDGGWRHHVPVQTSPSSSKIRSYARYARRHFEEGHFRLKKAKSLH